MKVAPSGFADGGGGRIERGTETQRDTDDSNYFDLNAWPLGRTLKPREAEGGAQVAHGSTVALVPSRVIALI